MNPKSRAATQKAGQLTMSLLHALEHNRRGNWTVVRPDRSISKKWHNKSAGYFRNRLKTIEES